MCFDVNKKRCYSAVIGFGVYVVSLGENVVDFGFVSN